MPFLEITVALSSSIINGLTCIASGTFSICDILAGVDVLLVSERPEIFNPTILRSSQLLKFNARLIGSSSLET
jgi:hypothetical protein